MTNNIIACITITALAILITPSTAIEANGKTQAAIDSVCRQMENYQFCNQVFSNNLPQPDTDNIGLTNITISEAKKHATSTLNFIQAQIQVEKDPVLLDHYKDCEGAYEFIQKAFERASQAFDQGDYVCMEENEEVTPKVQAQCTTIFDQPPVIVNPLNRRNTEMRILITMAVVTGSLIV